MNGIRYFLAALITAGSVPVVVHNARAAGCLSGGAAGAVVGHVAGHHAVLGAVGGCIAGHEIKKGREKQAHQAAQTQPPPQN